MKHITPIQAELYLNNQVGIIHSALIKQHLSRCQECAGLITSAQENNNLANELRDAVNTIPDNASPGMEEKTQLKIKNKLPS